MSVNGCHLTIVFMLPIGGSSYHLLIFPDCLLFLKLGFPLLAGQHGSLYHLYWSFRGLQTLLPISLPLHAGAGLLPRDPRTEKFFSLTDLETIWPQYPLSEQVLQQAISVAKHTGLPARWEVEHLGQLLSYERQVWLRAHNLAGIQLGSNVAATL